MLGALVGGSCRCRAGRGRLRDIWERVCDGFTFRLSPKGLATLERVVEAVEVPVLAVGGITADNLPEVLATGCAGVAVIGAILAAPDPAEAAAAFRAVLGSALARPRYALPQRNVAVAGDRS